MRIREMKQLKVGDKIRLKHGSIKEMRLSVGICRQAVGDAIDIDPIVEVVQPVLEGDNAVYIKHKDLGYYWFTKSWIESKVSAPLSKGVSAPPAHELSEVLTWVAQGKSVEFRNPRGGSRWQVLDTRDNFSFFSDFEYRLYKEPEKPKSSWVFVDAGEYSISGPMTEEDATTILGKEKQKITI